MIFEFLKRPNSDNNITPIPSPSRTPKIHQIENDDPSNNQVLPLRQTLKYTKTLEENKNLLDENERLKSLFPFEINEGEKLMILNFTTSDNKFCIPIVCKNTEELAVVEQRFYREDEEIRKTFMDESNFYLSSGNLLNKNKTIDENNIKDKEKIIMYLNETPN